MNPLKIIFCISFYPQDSFSYNQNILQNATSSLTPLHTPPGEINLPNNKIQTCFVGNTVTIEQSLTKQWRNVQYEKNLLPLGEKRGVGASNPFEMWPHIDSKKYILSNPTDTTFRLALRNCDYTDEGEYQLTFEYFSAYIPTPSDTPSRLQIYKKPGQPELKKEGQWRQLGYVLEAKTKKEIAYCQTSSKPKSTHVWKDNEGFTYTSTEKINIDETTGEATTISYLELIPKRSLHGKRFSCEARYEVNNAGVSPELIGEQFRNQFVSALEVQFPPDQPTIFLNENKTELHCSTSGRPAVSYEIVLIEPSGKTVKTFQYSSTNYIPANSQWIKDLQSQDTEILRNSNGAGGSLPSTSQIACHVKNSRGLNNVTLLLKDVLNPVNDNIFQSAVVWVKDGNNLYIALGVVGGVVLVIIVTALGCRGSKNNTSRSKNRTNEDEREILNLNETYRSGGDYTVGRSEFSYNIQGSSHQPERTTSRASRQSIVRRKEDIRKHHAKEFSDDEGGGFDDPMQQYSDQQQYSHQAHAIPAENYLQNQVNTNSSGYPSNSSNPPPSYMYTQNNAI